MELSDLPEDMREHIKRLFFTGIRHSLLLWRQVQGFQCVVDDQTLAVRTNDGWFVEETRVTEKCHHLVGVRAVNHDDPEDYAFTDMQKLGKAPYKDLDAAFLTLVDLIRYRKKGAMHRTLIDMGPNIMMEVVQQFGYFVE